MSETAKCPSCGSTGKPRQKKAPAKKAKLRQPKSLAAAVRHRLRQTVQVKKTNGTRKRVRFERVVGRVWYEIDPMYRIDPAAKGGPDLISRSDV